MIQQNNSVPSAETKDDSSINVDVTTSAPITPNHMLAAAFWQGDKIIWDSGFGYELGEFVSDTSIMEYCFEVNLLTGNSACRGRSIRPKKEIKKYSVELAIELTKKYKCYFKDFDDRIYFKTQGQEPNIDCIEPCPIVNNENTSKIMIGSVVCQNCPNHLFNDKDNFGDISFIVCSKLLGSVR